MADQAGKSPALINAALVRDHVCAQCYGRLVERYLDDEFKVVCPKGCQPGGFCTQAWADSRRAESAAELDEVARHYPQLDMRPKRSPEQQRAAIDALFGREE